MGHPARIDYHGKRLDFTALSGLTFETPDTERFPCLNMAREALKTGGTAPVILNGANEVAVAAFLKNGIRFGQIPEIVMKTLERCPVTGVSSCEDVYAADRLARETAEGML